VTEHKKKLSISDELLLKKNFNEMCTDSALGQECTFHQLAPYIGKIKSSIARFLIENFTNEGDFILDPFCGAGTIPFEGWILDRNVIANDLNEYGVVLTNGKLFPPDSLTQVEFKIELYNKIVLEHLRTVDLRSVPPWVRAFFHNETLREIIAWNQLLKDRKEWFLLSCLLGILHHQRPGFLSYPCSHTVPYLRVNKFPRDDFPELFEYRNVKDRLLKKAKRAFKKMPALDRSLHRSCYKKDASNLFIKRKIDAIISSPPYMRQLDYARDNRLRLWFLGVADHKHLDKQISPKESEFISMITKCLKKWNECLKNDGKCILFLGDNYIKKKGVSLPSLIEDIAVHELKTYKLIFKHESTIPNNRRIRRNYQGNRSETILVLQKVV
jgi:DNA modification methylase